jgi:hypothetical protein
MHSRLGTMKVLLIFLLLVVLYPPPSQAENGLKKFAGVFKKITPKGGQRVVTLGSSGHADHVDRGSSGFYSGAGGVDGRDDDENDWVRKTADVLEEEISRRVSSQTGEIEQEMKHRNAMEVEEKVEQARIGFERLIEGKLKKAEEIHMREVSVLRHAYESEIEQLRRAIQVATVKEMRSEAEKQKLIGEKKELMDMALILEGTGHADKRASRV